MVFSLASCGASNEPPIDQEETEDDEEDDDNDKPEPDTDPVTVAEPVHYPGSELARKSVYKAEYLDIDVSEDYLLNSHGETEDGIWMLFVKYSGYGRGDATECLFIEIDRDGNVTKRFTLQDNPYDNPEVLLDEHSVKYAKIDYSYFSDFNYSEDDVVEVVIPVASFDSRDNRTVSVFDLRWDSSGEYLGSALLPVDVGDYGYCNTFNYTRDDELLICYDYYGERDQSSRAILLGKDRFDQPKKSVLAENDNDTELGYSAGSIVSREDGLYMLSYTNTFSDGGVAEGKIDLSDLSVTYTGEVSQLGSGRAYAIGYNDEGYFFHHFSGVEYSSINEKGKIILDFANSDICSNGFNFIIPIDGLDKLFCVDFEGITPRFMMCTSVDPESIEECPVITLAYDYPGTALPQWIYDFNTSDNGCRIVVKDYSFYEERDNYYAWRDKLQEDILNGRMCDITYIENMDDLDIRLIAEKGLLADVGALITDDPDMDLDDFAINVFEAAAIDGKLFQVIPYFSVETVMGSDSYMSGYENWSVDDFLALDEELKASDAHMFTPYVTRERFVEAMMKITGSSWVNMDSCTCDFTDPSFMKLIGYALSLDESFNYYGYGADYWEKEAELHENGSIRLEITRIPNAPYMISNGYSSFNDKPAYVGFPSPDSEGSAISFDYNVILKADSEHLSECWEVVKKFLQPEYQDRAYTMPVLLDSLEKKIDEYNADTVTQNEDGEEISSHPTYSFNEVEYEVPDLSDREMEAYLNQILSVSNLYFTDEVIIDMVKDAVSEGGMQGKTPEEIASAIQLQVLDYLNEKYR